LLITGGNAAYNVNPRGRKDQLVNQRPQVRTGIIIVLTSRLLQNVIQWIDTACPLPWWWNELLFSTPAHWIIFVV